MVGRSHHLGWILALTTVACPFVFLSASRIVVGFQPQPLLPATTCSPSAVHHHHHHHRRSRNRRCNIILQQQGNNQNDDDGDNRKKNGTNQQRRSFWNQLDDVIDDFVMKRMGAGEQWYGKRKANPSGRVDGDYNGMGRSDYFRIEIARVQKEEMELRKQRRLRLLAAEEEEKKKAARSNQNKKKMGGK